MLLSAAEDVRALALRSHDSTQPAIAPSSLHPLLSAQPTIPPLSPIQALFGNNEHKRPRVL